jgi:predicted N-acetyltransferase YhbS
MTDIVIRDAVPADIPALHALIESAYRGEASRAGWTTEADLLDGQRTDPQELGEIIADPDQALLVAWQGREAVACVRIVKLAEGMGYFGMLSVRPTLQAAGMGRRMVAEAEQALARRFGAGRVRIQVFPQRETLIAWYERLGYVATGETAPFPYGDLSFGEPRRDDLYFVLFEKALT